MSDMLIIFVSTAVRMSLIFAVSAHRCFAAVGD